MASKKLFLAGLIGLATISAVTAQTGSSIIYRGSGYDVTDTSLIPARRMEQQRDYLNRNYDYPAKPKNQWELGFGFGPLNVSGDVRSKSFYNRPLKGEALNTMGWHLSVRKAWGYVISSRLQYMQGAAHGYNWQQSTGYTDHGGNPYQALGYSSPGGAQSVYYAYKTHVQELSLQMLASLNNIKFHQARNKWSIHGMFGIGGLLYRTENLALSENGNRLDFATISLNAKRYDSVLNSSISGGGSTIPWSNGYFSTRKQVENDLRNLYDSAQWVPAERHDNRWRSGQKTFRPIATVGIGIQRAISKRISIGLEDKVSYTMDDLIDGQRWQEWPAPGNGGSAMTRDYDNINYLALSLGVNLGAKSVSPLWWLNPMDYAYNELTTGRRRGNVSNPCNEDTDGDGVSDCFDKCNDTPAGVAVNTTGCCLDTDHDGVCDYLDKQIITPTECQPVDADGVGHCPEPECCKRPIIEPIRCGGMNSGQIQFAPNSTKLSGGAMSQLNNLASQMRNNPSCKVIMAGNGTTKVEQQRSWARVKAAIDYMATQGIDRERFCFEYGQSGAASTVDYSVASESSICPPPPPPPHPNLK
jgi:OmpA-OmpF porin, OOP family